MTIKMRKFILIAISSVLLTGLMANKCEVNQYGQKGDDQQQQQPPSDQSNQSDQGQ